MYHRIFTLLFLIFLLSPDRSALAQSPVFCDPSNCLFWSDQPEAIDSQFVIYAGNQWSIDEWDNNLGCGFANQCENLKLLVYYPHLPAGEKRPLVVLIHGGGFVTGSLADFQATARNLARLGYVAATIDYRLCKRTNCVWMANLGCPALCNANFYTDLGTGAYVATLDANKAIRYLQENAANFHIDPEQVIVGGHSAGAWTAMNVAFMKQPEADAISPGYANAWGPLQPPSGIRGVLCFSGAVLDTALIDADEPYPVFALHGTCDPTVCYGYDAAFHCNSSYPKVYGGRLIAERLRQLGLGYYLFSGVGMGHDISPLQDAWIPEALRYMRTAMLCGSFVQKHAQAVLQPGSAECTLLQSDIPGCALQFNHSPLAISTLPLSAPWGGPPAPCGNGLVPAPEPTGTSQIRLYPSPAHDAVWVETPPGKGDFSISLFQTMGKEIRHWTVPGGSKEQLLLNDLPAGMYFFQCSAPGSLPEMKMVVKIQ